MHRLGGRSLLGAFVSSSFCARYARPLPSSCAASGAVLRRPLSSVPECPSPTCACRPTPADLEIDRKSPLSGTSPFYAEQAVVCTGRSDWPSKIEDDRNVPFLQALRSALGRGGKYSNPFHNVLLTASSLPPSAVSSTSDTSNPPAPPVLLFPSFTKVTFDQQSTLDACVDSLVRGFTNPPTLPARMPGSSAASPPNPLLVRDPAAQQHVTHGPITATTVLVCGHAARDGRCGAMGPLLAAEFRDKLRDAARAGVPGAAAGAQTGLISHVGGHKFAGNVVVYVPPTATVSVTAEQEGAGRAEGGDGALQRHPLAGMGVWYGRVEPRHVEGIVAQTIGRGAVIEELLRGGITADRRPLRL